jgi:hypothetical protein
MEKLDMSFSVLAIVWIKYLSFLQDFDNLKILSSLKALIAVMGPLFERADYSSI